MSRCLMGKVVPGSAACWKSLRREDCDSQGAPPRQLSGCVNMYQNVNDEPLLNLVKGVTSAERAVGAAAGLDRAGQYTAGLGRTALC